MKDWNLKGKKVTIMGLGLHGGGLASARFFASHGAKVTVTDLQTEEKLRPSIEKLKDFSIRYVLGEHKDKDFETADLVIKNPAVRNNNPFLAKAKRIETDITTFLSLFKGPIIAVTGSKGKSTVSSAIFHVLKQQDPRCRLGGNITISPLNFIEELEKTTPVVLELSSWQLADLKSRGLLKPKVSIITNILPDHLNAYNGSMDLYVDDKRIIYQEQEESSYSLFYREGEYTNSFISESRAQVGLFSKASFDYQAYGLNTSGWLTGQGATLMHKGKMEVLWDTPLALPGEHHRLNLLAASMALRIYGVDLNLIQKYIPSFTGVPHRLEKFHSLNGIDFYNDSAATIPEATAAALQAFPGRSIWCITGGTDKNLNFEVLKETAPLAKGFFLLEGSGTKKLLPLLKEWHSPIFGTYNDLESAVNQAFKKASSGDVIILSPGCASFEMFKNEFDRGDQFRTLCRKLS